MILMLVHYCAVICQQPNAGSFNCYSSTARREAVRSTSVHLNADFMSCHVMSCHVMSCHVMSCHVMSCHVPKCAAGSDNMSNKLLSPCLLLLPVQIPAPPLSTSAMAGPAAAPPGAASVLQGTVAPAAR